VENLTGNVVSALIRRQPNGGTFHIEDIQDQVELALMRSGEHEVARAYVLYREKRNEERNKQKRQQSEDHAMFCLENGERRPLDLDHLAPSSPPPAKACRKPTPRPSCKPPCATSTTACPWTRCASPSSCPPVP
jgi:hypothetical protein